MRKALPGFAAYLGGLLKKQLGAGKLETPVFSMWLHCVNPRKNEYCGAFTLGLS